MGIKVVGRTSERVRLVFSEDSDVEARRKGWMPIGEATSIAPKADIVTVRPLGVSDRAACFDAGGQYAHQTSLTEYCRRGIVAICGHERRDVIDQWFEAIPLNAASGLGAYIRSLSEGDDPLEVQARVYGKAATFPDEETAEAPKPRMVGS